MLQLSRGHHGCVKNMEKAVYPIRKPEFFLSHPAAKSDTLPADPALGSGIVVKVGYFHVVFTVPEQISSIAYQHRDLVPNRPLHETEAVDSKQWRVTRCPAIPGLRQFCAGENARCLAVRAPVPSAYCEVLMDTIRRGAQVSLFGSVKDICDEF
jgi:hypothetical protein